MSILPVIAYVLDKIVSTNDKRQSRPECKNERSKFEASHPVAISIQDYLARFQRYAHVSDETFILAVIYMDRICRRTPHQDVLLNSLSVHRLLLTSILVAVKFWVDGDCTKANKFYAQVGGIPCDELSLLEMEFLSLISFDINVRSDVYNTYKDQIETHSTPAYASLSNRQPESSTKKNPRARYGNCRYHSSALKIRQQLRRQKANVSDENYETATQMVPDDEEPTARARLNRAYSAPQILQKIAVTAVHV